MKDLFVTSNLNSKLVKILEILYFLKTKTNLQYIN